MRASAQVLRTAAGPGGTSSPTRAILGLAPGRAGAGTGVEEGGRDNQPSRHWARLPPTELPSPRPAAGREAQAEHGEADPSEPEAP